MTKRCEDCRHWDNSTQDGTAQPDTTGLCRIYPPTVNGITGKTHWPFTENTDWCDMFYAAEQFCGSCATRVELDSDICLACGQDLGEVGRVPDPAQATRPGELHGD